MECALEAMLNILEQIDVLCVPSIEKSKEFHQNLKSLFDLSIKSCSVELGPLVEIYVKNMDSESIWEQVQSRNRPLNRYIEQNTKNLYKAAPSVEVRNKPFDRKQKSKTEEKVSVEDADGSNEIMDDDSDTEESDDDGDDNNDDAAADDDADDDADEDDEDDDNNDELQSEGEEMENWLDEMDEAEAARQEKQLKKTNKNHDDVDDDEDEDDEVDENDEAFVQRELYALDEDSEGDISDDDDEVNVTEAKFEDFFGSSMLGKGKVRRTKGPSVSSKTPLDVDKDSEEEEESNEDENNDDSDVDDSENEEDREEIVPETNYSRKKRLLQEQIALLEENAIGTKSWEVSGEVKSSQRPENSLLGIPVDVERSSKLTPVINQEYLKTLEDMIIQRIKDSNFDNIVLDASGTGHKNEQVSVTDDAMDVSQEKSKLGLGEIYAEQFLKQSANFDANASKQEKEVNAMILHFQKVCRQLDALSHFQFAPKPVGSSADSSSMAVQSIALEDVAPITMLSGGDSSTAQAPEQSVGKKRGLDAQFVGGDEEITRSDRQKMRRKQKKKQNSSGKSAASNVLSEKNDTYQDLKNDSRVIQKNTERNTGKSEYSKSSNFFARMQEEVSSGIRKKKHEGDKTDQRGVQDMRSSRMKL